MCFEFEVALNNCVIEVDDQSAVQVCENNGYRYSIITKDDIVIPPEELDCDLLSEG